MDNFIVRVTKTLMPNRIIGRHESFNCGRPGRVKVSRTITSEDETSNPIVFHKKPKLINLYAKIVVTGELRTKLKF